MKQTKNWDEYYRCRVRDKAYIDKFSFKYSRFIKEIIFEIKMLAHDVGMPIILKEEGCGIGTVSMAISNMEKMYRFYGANCYFRNKRSVESYFL